jgi:predicted DCC family thiol-disulfide oxidoreductase YuxK
MDTLLIYYDSQCNLCINIKNIISKLDSSNQITFCELGEDEERLKAVDRNGNEYFSEDVLTEVAKILPGIKRFSWMFEGDMGKKTSKLFYQGLDKIRKTHGRKTSGCGRC